ASLSFSAPSNTTYYILVGGSGGSGGNLSIVATIVTPPANDTCAGAIALASGVTNFLNTFNATEFDDLAPSCNGSMGLGLSYKISTPAYNPRLDISTCGSDFRTIIAVYTIAFEASPAQLHFPSFPTRRSSDLASLSFSAPSNTTYYILVGGSGGSGEIGRASGRERAQPAKDACALAIELASGVTNFLNTFNATEFDDLAPSCNGAAGLGGGEKI